MEESESEEDKFATIKANDGSSTAALEQFGQVSEQQSSTSTTENAGVNLYILAGHEDMRMEM